MLTIAQWTANYNSIHWIVPTLAGVFLASSIVLIFVAFLNYLTDTYLMYAASAVAANTVARSAAGAAAPLFTNQMFTALGVGGGASLVGGVAAALAVVPFVFYKYGEGIRKRSRFAPTPSKKDEEAPESGLDGQKEKEEERSDVIASDSTSTSDTSCASSAILPVNEAESNVPLTQKKERRKDEVPQNAFGQPRTENLDLGKERAEQA